MATQFGSRSDQNLRLKARAKQFSCYMLLLGKIESADTFAPSSAIIVQNKDDLSIPLLLEQLPSAREFRDAINSLSNEQKRYR